MVYATTKTSEIRTVVASVQAFLKVMLVFFFNIHASRVGDSDFSMGFQPVLPSKHTLLSVGG